MLWKDPVCVFFRNSPNPEDTEKPNTKYIIVRFDRVTNLEVYDWDNKKFVPYTNNSFEKESDAAISYINCLDYIGDSVVFDECMRFRCEDVEESY